MCLCVNKFNRRCIFLFALASCVAKNSSGEDSDGRSLYELRCQASNTSLIEPFFFIKFNGFREVAPYFDFS